MKKSITEKLMVFLHIWKWQDWQGFKLGRLISELWPILKCVSGSVNFLSQQSSEGADGGVGGGGGGDGGGGEGVCHWVSLNTRLCRLTVWAEEDKAERLQDIDLMGATFTYDLENNNCGQFKIRWDIITCYLIKIISCNLTPPDQESFHLIQWVNTYCEGEMSWQTLIRFLKLLVILRKT